MPDFTILAVATRDGHLVVDVEHFDVVGAHWFYEDYVFQGREGLKRKRTTNAMGELLMDDGRVAPTRLDPDDPAGLTSGQYLPVGRTWQLQSTPWMGDESILTTIRSIHAQRLVSKFPGKDNRLTPNSKLKPSGDDTGGVGQLLTKFSRLVDYSE